MDEIIPVAFPEGQMFSKLRVFEAKSIEIVRDGSEGGGALIRVTGQDASLPYAEEALGFKMGSIRLKMVYEYELNPGDTFITIRTHLTNTGRSKKDFRFGNIYFLGDGLQFFSPDHGYTMDALGKDFHPFIGLEGPDVSYGLHYPDNAHQVIIARGAISGAAGEPFPLAPDDTLTKVQHLSIGTGDLNSVQMPFMEEPGTVVGMVQGADSLPGPAQVFVFAPDKEQPHTVCRTDLFGGYRCFLPAGTWHLRPGADGHPLGAPVTVEVPRNGTLTQDLALPPTGKVAYVVRDETGQLLPATLAFEPVGDIARNDITRPAKAPHGNFEDIVFSPLGIGELHLVPGRYKVHISRGLEYELVQQDLTLAPGAAAAVSAVLTHSVNTTGFLGGDFHLHALGSNDSNDTYEEKLAAIAATGVEVPVATDHDHISDYAPYIRHMSLTPWMASIVGLELTTVKWGHFNTFPVTRDTSLPNNGAIDWYGKTVPEIFEEVRRTRGAQVLQLNHPRSMPSGLAGQGYLQNIGYSPEKGTAQNSRQFSLDFDAMEIVNGKRVDELPRALQDWISFLNMDKRVTGTGVSDSHRAYALEVGYSRTLVRSSTDDPARMNEQEFVDNLKHQRATVDGGHFFTVSVNGHEHAMGETFHDEDGTYDVTLHVESPTWIDLTKVELLENGEKIHTFDVKPADGVVKFHHTLQLSPKRDSWYVAFGFGEKDLFPVYPGAKPLSFTNPFWLDVDGDGKFTPLLTPEP